MTIENLKNAAEIAKSRTSDKRWIAAIDKAVAGVESGKWIVTELANCLAITTESEKTYKANDKHCQCEAFFRGQACKHRSLYRLYSIADTEAATPATSRADVIAKIQTIWSRTQRTPLADALMARFRVNSLSFLADDMLAGVLAAIA